MENRSSAHIRIHLPIVVQPEVPRQGEGPREQACNHKISAPSIKAQLDALITLLQEPTPENSLAAYQDRLRTVADRLTAITALLPADLQAHADVIAANAQSATTPHPDVSKAADAIVLHNSKFNHLAAQLPNGRIFAISNLSREWAQYQKKNDQQQTANVIQRLVKIGVLEYVDPLHVRRTSTPVGFKTERQGPTPIHASPLKRPNVTPQGPCISPKEISEMLRKQPEIGDCTLPLSRAFGTDPHDTFRLVAALATGASIAQAGKLWTPALRTKPVLKILHKATGMTLTAFREGFSAVLANEFVSELSERITQLIVDEVYSRDPQASILNNQEMQDLTLRVLVPHLRTSEDVSEFSRITHHNDQDLDEYISAVLVKAKDILFPLLLESRLLPHLGTKGEQKVQLAQLSQLTGNTLTSIGETYGLSRERVRQNIAYISAIHPLVQGIIEAAQPTNTSSNSSF